jgi:hypothetical protein
MLRFLLFIGSARPLLPPHTNVTMRETRRGLNGCFILAELKLGGKTDDKIRGCLSGPHPFAVFRQQIALAQKKALPHSTSFFSFFLFF